MLCKGQTEICVTLLCCSAVATSRTPVLVNSSAYLKRNHRSILDYQLCYAIAMLRRLRHLFLSNLQLVVLKLTEKPPVLVGLDRFPDRPVRSRRSPLTVLRIVPLILPVFLAMLRHQKLNQALAARESFVTGKDLSSKSTRWFLSSVPAFRMQGWLQRHAAGMHFPVQG